MKPGEILRAEREKRGLSLVEVENTTKIRAKYLEALENDAYQEIPGEVYRLGFLRNYARFLGIDPTSLVDHYKSLAGDTGTSAPPQILVEEIKGHTKEPVEEQRHRIFFAFPWKKVLGIAVVVVIALIIMAFVASGSRKKEEPTPQPSNTEITQKPPATEFQKKGIIMDLVCRQDCWVRVVADGEEQFAGYLHPEDKKSFNATESIKIRLGNAGGVDIFYNGEKMPPAGRMGEVIDKEFTASS